MLGAPHLSSGQDELGGKKKKRTEKKKKACGVFLARFIHFVVAQRSRPHASHTSNKSLIPTNLTQGTYVRTYVRLQLATSTLLAELPRSIVDTERIVARLRDRRSSLIISARAFFFSRTFFFSLLLPPYGNKYRYSAHEEEEEEAA